MFRYRKTENGFLDVEQDNDPAIPCLRFFEYRYLRFIYHTLDDEFQLANVWKIPVWKNAKDLRGGLDAQEKDCREQVYGYNLMDIQQKSVVQLLVDEVCFLFFLCTK